jgi:hypothetical protein
MALNLAAARGDKGKRVDRACAIAGDMAMPLLLHEQIRNVLLSEV